MTCNRRPRCSSVNLRPGDSAIVAALTATWRHARCVRDDLNRGKWWWQRWSLASFHEAVARLVDAGVLERQVIGESIHGNLVYVHWLRRRERTVMSSATGGCCPRRPTP